MCLYDESIITLIKYNDQHKIKKKKDYNNPTFNNNNNICVYSDLIIVL